MELPIYAIVGDRPVKAIATPEGGMDVLSFNWEIGEFERDIKYTTTLVSPMDEDVEFVDEETFNQKVEELKTSLKKD